MSFYKNNLIKLSNDIIKEKNIILEFIDDDEIMALMNLTKLYENPLLYQTPLSQDILQYHEIISVSYYSIEHSNICL